MWGVESVVSRQIAMAVGSVRFYVACVFGFGSAGIVGVIGVGVSTGTMLLWPHHLRAGASQASPWLMVTSVMRYGWPRLAYGDSECRRCSRIAT